MTYSEKQLQQDLQNLNVPVNHENLRKMARSHSLSVKFLKNVDDACDFHVASQSNNGIYEVTLKADGSCACTCKDFTVRESPICKHILRSKKFMFDYPHEVHMTEQDREEFNDWMDPQNANTPDPAPADFDADDGWVASWEAEMAADEADRFACLCELY